MSRAARVLFGLVLVVLAVAPTGDLATASATTETGSLVSYSGRVVTSEGVPVPGVSLEVSAGGSTGRAVTDGTGSFGFSVVEGQGRFQLGWGSSASVAALGLPPTASFGGPVVVAGPWSGDLVLPPVRSVSASVRTQAGDPVAGAVVTAGEQVDRDAVVGFPGVLDSAAALPAPVQTDASGVAVLEVFQGRLTDLRAVYRPVESESEISSVPIELEVTADTAVDLVVPGPPAAPAALAASPLDGAVTVHWQPPTQDGGSPVTAYEVTATAEAGVRFALSADAPASVVVGPSARSVTLSGLENGTPYRVAVRARNEYGLGAASTTTLTPAGDTTAPVVTLRSPAHGAVYPVGQALVADYDCADEPGGSGVAACDGDEVDGGSVDTSSAGPASFEVSARDVAGNTTTVTSAYTLAFGRPDVAVRQRDGSLLGDGTYHPTGQGQRRAKTVRRGETVSYVVVVQNDAAFADELVVRGSPSAGRFQVRYSVDGRGVTGAVTGGTYTTTRLEPGAGATLRVEITSSRRAPVGARFTATVSARSSIHRERKDAVALVATVR